MTKQTSKTPAVRRILEAGVCAPSGGNAQRGRFLVIEDAGIKHRVGALYRRVWDETVAPRYRTGEPAPGTRRDRSCRSATPMGRFGPVRHIALADVVYHDR